MILDCKLLDYFKYGKIENEKFWRRLGGEPNLEKKTILEFGCGYGSLCVDMAKKNVNSILGIDLNEKVIEFANINLEKNYNHLKNKIAFEKKDLLDENFNKKFDIIVTKDTFEHSENLPEILEKFYRILNNGGKVFAGFGPLYNFYNGDHGRTQLKLPWLHVLLPEKFIINRYNAKNQNQINRIEDLGLSKYSFADYKNIFSGSKFEIEYFVTNKTDNPILKTFNFLSKVKILSEYFTYNIYCVLKKN